MGRLRGRPGAGRAGKICPASAPMLAGHVTTCGVPLTPWPPRSSPLRRWVEWHRRVRVERVGAHRDLPVPGRSSASCSFSSWSRASRAIRSLAPARCRGSPPRPRRAPSPLRRVLPSMTSLNRSAARRRALTGIRPGDCRAVSAASNLASRRSASAVAAASSCSPVARSAAAWSGGPARARDGGRVA